MQDSIGISHESSERNQFGCYLMVASKAMSVLSGVLFIALVVMSIVSLIGRKLGFGSVNGDIELMQAGTAVAATAFLPYCTLLGEHIRVDLFTENMRESLKRPIDGVTELLLAVVACVLAWRTVLAAISAHESQEVTSLVSLPIWIPIALLVPSLGLMAICAFYRAYVHLRPGEFFLGVRT